MRWLVALWLDLWRGPYTATPAPTPPPPASVTMGPPEAPRKVYLRPPRAFTFERRQ